MFKATKLITEALDEHKLTYSLVDEEQISIVKIGFNNETGSAEEYFFISTNDYNDVDVRSCTIARVPEALADTILPMLNSFNCKFRFARFCLDNDNNITIHADLPIETRDADLGKSAIDLLVCLREIYKETYPAIMTYIWS